MDLNFNTPFGPQMTYIQRLKALWVEDLLPIYELFPAWLWTFFALVLGLWIIYIKDRVVVYNRARRWRIQRRRFAGIPDSDKRPFAIAKKDAEERSAKKMERAFIAWEDNYLAAPQQAQYKRHSLAEPDTHQFNTTPSPVRNIPSPPPDEPTVLQITCTPQQVWQYFFDYGLLESDEWPDIHDQNSVKTAFQLAMLRLEERGGTLRIAEVQ